MAERTFFTRKASITDYSLTISTIRPGKLKYLIQQQYHLCSDQVIGFPFPCLHVLATLFKKKIIDILLGHEG